MLVTMRPSSPENDFFGQSLGDVGMMGSMSMPVTSTKGKSGLSRTLTKGSRGFCGTTGPLILRRRSREADRARAVSHSPQLDDNTVEQRSSSSRILVPARPPAATHKTNGGGPTFEFVGPAEPQKAQQPLPASQDPAARFQLDLQDNPNLRFKDGDALRTAAQSRGWVPFENKTSGERGFWIPEVPDSVVYASWERGLDHLPRADTWLQERGRSVPKEVSQRLNSKEDEEAQRLEREKQMQEEARKKVEEEARRKAEQEAQRLLEEQLMREALQEKEEAKRLAAEANQRRRSLMEKEERRRRRKERKEEEAVRLLQEEVDRLRREEEEFLARLKEQVPASALRQLEESFRDHPEDEAEDAATRMLREVEQERLYQQQMAEEREVAQRLSEATAKEQRREAEQKNFLRRHHGKTAAGHLAHEGKLDRDVWDRPDEEAKRLGHLDPHHVASGGVTSAKGTAGAKEYVRALEHAVQAQHPEVRSPSARSNSPFSPPPRR